MKIYRTRTREEFNWLMEYLDKHGYVWNTGDHMMDNKNYFDDYKERTSLYVRKSGVTYGYEEEDLGMVPVSEPIEVSEMREFKSVSEGNREGSPEVKRIYLANDLFSEANRQYNEFVAGKIEENFRSDVDMYVPQRNTGINNKDAYADSQMILKADYEALKDSDILVAILDSNDVGVALEIGMAYMLEIPIIGLFTDVRQQGTSNAKKVEAIKTIGENQFIYLNLMLSGAVKERGALVSNVDDLLEELKNIVYPIKGK